MPRSSAKQKRQTQLSFTPLPPSSPAMADASPAVRERLAHVAYSGSPSPGKKRKVAAPRVTTSRFEPTSSTQPSQQTPRLSQRSFIPHQVTSQKRRYSGHTEDSSSDSSVADSDSDVVLTSRKPVSSPLSAPSPSRGRRSRLILDSDDDDHDYAQTARAPQGRSTKIDANDESNDDDDDDHDDNDDHDHDDNDDVLPRQQRRNRRAVATDEDSSGNEGHDRDDEDLKEDLDFLQASSPTSMVRKSGGVSEKQKRQQALEAYRRSRQQKTESSQTAQTTDDERDETSDSPVNEFQEETVNDDEDDDDFLDDRNVDENAPPVALPGQFSSLRTASTKQLFKHAVEWMVQKKINPAFPMEDEVYQITFDRLDHKVKGLGESSFQSSSWSGRFLSALENKPVLQPMHTGGGDGFMRDHCQACNRRSHPATWDATFKGRPYDRDTLEPDSDADEDDSDDETHYTFALGKNCMANARTAHTFAHWRYHLMVWVVDWLRDEQYLSADKIVARDSWSTRRKRQYANEIVDAMETDGVIRQLWHDFTANLHSAHRQLDGE